MVGGQDANAVPPAPGSGQTSRIPNPGQREAGRGVAPGMSVLGRSEKQLTWTPTLVPEAQQPVPLCPGPGPPLLPPSCPCPPLPQDPVFTSTPRPPTLSILLTAPPGPPPHLPAPPQSPPPKSLLSLPPRQGAPCGPQPRLALSLRWVSPVNWVNWVSQLALRPHCRLKGLSQHAEPPDPSSPDPHPPG